MKRVIYIGCEMKISAVYFTKGFFTHTLFSQNNSNKYKCPNLNHAVLSCLNVIFTIEFIKSGAPHFKFQ